MGVNDDRVLLIGNSKLLCSVTICLLQTGHQVYLVTDEKKSAEERIQLHLDDLRRQNCSVDFAKNLRVFTELKENIFFKLIVIVNDENLERKKLFIKKAEQFSLPGSIICINTESILLSVLQAGSLHPERLIGVNWTEPAHTTFFLELIKNSVVSDKVAGAIFNLAEKRWSKHPYIVRDELGIRSKIMAAMAREAFYLVDNSYVTAEDIDRAFRNDAGYYLSFVGICRYMDLMGPYAYGKVMKELNPDLSKAEEVPGFFKERAANERAGMANGKGMFEYTPEGVKEWDKRFRKFSYEIKRIIEKYPFDYK